MLLLTDSSIDCHLFNFFYLSWCRYVFSAPDQLLESMPGTLMLTDCLEACQANESCGAVNYETGLCVLFSSNADKLPGKCLQTEKWWKRRKKTISVLFCCNFNYDKCLETHPEIVTASNSLKSHGEHLGRVHDIWTLAYYCLFVVFAIIAFSMVRLLVKRRHR